ncbi:hypothetical protein ACFOW1_12220 [Parasediminibacterium paludis]|uniref:Uncharacterized protein n=1 Tax=Parasediminibacterium paludis TaxID=908966 RepID=A0ABV8PX20_9BACT
MISKLCNVLNDYYSQFSQGIIDKPINIRPIKWDDVLLNDTLIFLNEQDENKHASLLVTVKHLEAERSLLVKKLEFQNASLITEQKNEYINSIEALMHKGSFASKYMFTLTLDCEIVYTNKHLINGNLFKKFINVS